MTENPFDKFPDIYHIEQSGELESGADLFYVYHDKAEEWREKWEPLILEKNLKAEKYDEEQQLTSREAYERLLLQQTDLVNNHFTKRLEAEDKLDAIKKILEGCVG